MTRFAIEMNIGGAFERLPEDGLYNTREKAEQEIKDHITNCINAVEAGDMDDSPDPSDFRVVEVVASANTNCLEGLRCPDCGNEDRLKIVARIMCMVTDDGSDPYGDHEWDDESFTICPECDRDGPLAEFKA